MTTDTRPIEQHLLALAESPDGAPERCAAGREHALVAAERIEELEKALHVAMEWRDPDMPLVVQKRIYTVLGNTDSVAAISNTQNAQSVASEVKE